MPYYNYLKYDFKTATSRDYVINKILKLKKQLVNEIPDKDAENNLLLATWNIRDFNKKDRRGFGKRTADSLYYIAEIISSFDLVAVQEVNELVEWQKVMNILGDTWDYIATDVADIRAGGNESAWSLFMTGERYGLKILLVRLYSHKVYLSVKRP